MVIVTRSSVSSELSAPGKDPGMPQSAGRTTWSTSIDACYICAAHGTPHSAMGKTKHPSGWDRTTAVPWLASVPSSELPRSSTAPWPSCGGQPPPFLGASVSFPPLRADGV
ncbi:MAG: hypothetical protein BJ554DRAFT_3610 [Olpidium bornovanus]|uniref:Uncharacterized protein n=1 Tax=Olpidium bornovanus TaxID=278681 RepID=A0A8H8DLI1_9FUNG|nr:MAG: hypothetical protein BJ554DRAFT_3610 [Olpidium bornovanus]